MRAGYANLRRGKKSQQRKVGREEEGSSSNRQEIAAFVFALRCTPVVGTDKSNDLDHFAK